jgi:hypothetical protein
MIRAGWFCVVAVTVLLTGSDRQGRDANAQSRRALLSVPVTLSGNESNLKKLVDVPNASVRISTTGRPVFVALIPEGSNKSPSFEPYSISASGLTKARPASNWTIAIIRDSNVDVVAITDSISMSHNDPGAIELPLSINCIDSPPAGQHVYTIRVQVVWGQVEIKGARLVAYEL